MSLFSRTSDLPGLQATLRDCTVEGKGLKRLRKGDIAVIDSQDISRREAQRLLDAAPAAVVNLARFSSGSIPNFGPNMLLDAGMTLVEGAGEDLRHGLKDGKKGRLTDDGAVHIGTKTIGAGEVLTRAGVDENFALAQQSLVDHMEAFFGNTIEFIHSEGPLLIDGLGVPDTGVNIEGRKVLVVSPGVRHREEVKQLRNFIREYQPVIIGVEEAADTLVELGYKPELIVGNPATIGADTLRCGARVILPAEPDGHAAGLERIQDLGIGAMTFPTAADSATDLALLLADYHGAQLIALAGSHFDLDAVFDRAPHATPSALLARTKVGAKLVDGAAIADLYTIPSSKGLAWLWAILGLLIALAVVVAIAGTAGDDTFINNLIDTWNSIALRVQGWFN